MIRNYLLIAWRSLRKNRASSFINITGLAAGMAVTILIGLWIWDEVSFDHYYDNYRHIAQVMERETVNGNLHTSAAIALPMEAAMTKSYGADLKHIVMCTWNDGHILSVGDKHVAYPGVFIGSGAPEMLSLRMVAGSRDGLRGPSSLLLSESVARALFGTADPVGKVVTLDNKVGFSVAGVYADMPLNTSFHDVAFMAPWDFFVHAQDWLGRDPANWDDNSLFMYVQTADHEDIAAVSKKIRNIKLDHAGPKDAAFKPEVFLQPMSRWHLYSEFKHGVNTGGAIDNVWLFGIIGFFVLLLACINFMNLSTARSEKRAREVGIRKAIGSVRSQLIGQFYVESLLYALIAFGGALLMAWLALPYFNSLSGKRMVFLWDRPWFWAAGLGFTLLTGLIAGSYPALYLSSFRPVEGLKGSRVDRRLPTRPGRWPGRSFIGAGRYAALPRKVLVVLQFAVSVVLIIGTVVVFRQIQYAKDRPVGYDRAGLVTIATATADLHEHFDAVRADLLRSGMVSEIAESTSPATAVFNDRSDVSWEGKDPRMTPDFGNIGVSVNYGRTVGWQFVAGRDFTTMKTDSGAGPFPGGASTRSDSPVTFAGSVILNETAVKYMGLRDPVGQMIRVGRSDLRIVGVVKDMVMGSPYQAVKQTLFRLGNRPFDYVDIRINPAVSAHAAIAAIAAVSKVYAPGVPFTYSFADEDYARKFVSEERVGALARCFAVLAIFISALGLFGMASFVAEQRTREIGVRKVLGASVFGLWGLLSKEFVYLTGIALLLAMPAAYYFMSGWLQHYAYRTAMPWWIFASVAVLAVLLTLLTVSYQAVRAALMNPVDSLRSE